MAGFKTEVSENGEVIQLFVPTPNGESLGLQFDKQGFEKFIMESIKAHSVAEARSSSSTQTQHQSQPPFPSTSELQIHLVRDMEVAVGAERGEVDLVAHTFENEILRLCLAPPAVHNLLHSLLEIQKPSQN